VVEKALEAGEVGRVAIVALVALYVEELRQMLDWNYSKLTPAHTAPLYGVVSQFG
jgi:hypothetical protein